MYNFVQRANHTVDAFPTLEQIGRSSEWSKVVQGKIESPPYCVVSTTHTRDVVNVLPVLQQFVLLVLLSWQW